MVNEKLKTSPVELVSVTGEEIEVHGEHTVPDTYVTEDESIVPTKNRYVVSEHERQFMLWQSESMLAVKCTLVVSAGGIRTCRRNRFHLVPSLSNAAVTNSMHHYPKDKYVNEVADAAEAEDQKMFQRDAGVPVADETQMVKDPGTEVEL